jgi:hypothetical protein
MTPPTHSPEHPFPWRIVQGYDNRLVIEDENGNVVTRLHFFFDVNAEHPCEPDDEQEYAAIQHLLACVNACREVPPAELEGKVFRQQIVHLRYGKNPFTNRYHLEDSDYAE